MKDYNLQKAKSFTLAVSAVSIASAVLIADVHSMPKSITSDAFHTLEIENNTNEVFASGRDGFGRALLGPYATSSQELIPQATGLIDIQSVNAAPLNSAALTNDGEVFVWGMNWSTRTTIGNPTKIPNLAGVTDMALTTRGALFIANNALIGYDYNSTFTYPSVSAINFKNVDAKGFNAFAIAQNGDLYAFGTDNSLGQLGLGAAITEQLTPTKIPNLAGVVDVAAGTKHTAALTQSGEVFVWGNNALGQLGNTDLTVTYDTPVSLNVAYPELDNVTIVNVEVSSSATFMLDSAGMMHVVGWHVLNHGSINTTTRGALENWDIAPQGTQIVNINMEASVYFLTLNTGEVLNWGGNTGRLGDGTITGRRTLTYRLAGIYAADYAVLNPAPVVIPVIADIQPGGSYIITGTDYGDTQGLGQVFIDTTELTVISWSNTSIHVENPTVEISGLVTVINDKGVVSNNFQATMLPEALPETVLQPLQCNLIVVSNITSKFKDSELDEDFIDDTRDYIEDTFDLTKKQFKTVKKLLKGKKLKDEKLKALTSAITSNCELYTYLLDLELKFEEDDDDDDDDDDDEDEDEDEDEDDD